MLGWVQLLKKTGSDPEIYEKAVDAIERSARTQTQLVDDLLDIARISNDTLQVTMKRLDLTTTIEPAATAMRPVAGDRDIARRSRFRDSPCFRPRRSRQAAASG